MENNMKRLFLVLIMLFVSMLTFSNEDLLKALEESNALLEEANQEIIRLRNIINDNEKTKKIKELEEKIKELEEGIASRNELLKKANAALESSNDVLEDANERIEKDQVEIKDLRDRIKDLMNAGTELEIYKINFLLGYGYPHSIGFDVAVNFPFFTTLGLFGGVGYFFENEFVYARAGIKINIK
jgi:TolA-binding protein